MNIIIQIYRASSCSLSSRRPLGKRRVRAETSRYRSPDVSFGKIRAEPQRSERIPIRPIPTSNREFHRIPGNFQETPQAVAARVASALQAGCTRAKIKQGMELRPGGGRAHGVNLFLYCGIYFGCYLAVQRPGQINLLGGSDA